jgi:predicted transcriptional regulator
MTAKEKILSVIHSLDDDVSIDQAIDRLYLLRKIEIGIQQADAGDVIDHDEFMKQLEDDEAI